MTKYEVALFLHILGALSFFAGMAVAAVGHVAALRLERPSEIALVLRLTRVGVVLVAGGTLLILVFGLWLVDLGGWGFGTGWVSAALVLFVLAVVLGSIGGRRPKQARLLAERLAAEGDAGSLELHRLLHDRTALVGNYAAGLLSLTVVALMVFKP